MSRPVTYTKEKLEEINKKLLEYVDNTDIPVLAEFAYKNDLRRATLYDHELLSYAIQKAINKKEAQLEILALKNKINPTIAKFSLNQLGWSEKHENKNDGKIDLTIDYV